MKWIIDIIQLAIKEGFTGNIQINFFRGGIANITKTESIKPPEDGVPNEKLKAPKYDEVSYGGL